MGLFRFLLALTVIIAHSKPIFGLSFADGQTAVKAFYIISGFYMTFILNEKYIGANNSYRLFISNRFLRLFPVYWVVLAMAMLFFTITTIVSGPGQSGTLGLYLRYFDEMSLGSFGFLVFTNIFLFFQDTVMFMGLNTITGNLFFAPNFYETDPLLFQFLFIPQAWTIGVELTFYLMVPFLARKKIIYIIPLIIASLLIRYFLAKIGMKIDPWSYRFFPSELVFFLLGIISYRIYKFVPKLNLKPIYLIMILIYITTFSIFYKFLRQKYEFQIYMFSVFVCIPFLFTLTKSWKFDNYIGELTYPMYISHILVNSILLQLKIPEIGGLGLNLTVFTILFSILLHEVVVKKFERLRQRRLLPAPVPITVN